jgi:hypothetical protein
MSKPVVSRVGHILVTEFESWHDLRMELFKEVYEPLSVVFDEEIGKWRVSKVIAKDQREEYDYLLPEDDKDIA